MIRTTILITLVGLLLSCQPENRIFVDHKALSPNLEWMKSDAREFAVPITDKSIPYDLSISFRFSNGFQFSAANIEMTEIAPSGKMMVTEFPLKVKSADGSYIGDPGYDIWDSEHLIEKGKMYTETGTYKYILKHIMPQDKMHYAMEIGIILDKSQKENAQ